MTIINSSDLLLHTTLKTTSPSDTSIYNRTFAPSGAMAIWGGSGTGTTTCQFTNSKFILPYTEIFGTSDFTIEFDLYINMTDVNKALLGFIDSSGSGFSIGTNATGRVCWFSHSLGTRTLVHTSTANSGGANTSDRYAFVRNNGTLKIYIDGVLDSSVGLSDNLNATPTSLTIGGLISASTPALANLYYMIGNVRIVKNAALYLTNYTANTPFTTALPPVTLALSTPVTSKVYNLTTNSVSSTLLIPVPTLNHSFIASEAQLTIDRSVAINVLNIVSGYSGISLTFTTPSIHVSINTAAYSLSTSTVDTSRAFLLSVLSKSYNCITEVISYKRSLIKFLDSFTLTFSSGFSSIGYIRNIPTLNTYFTGNNLLPLYTVNFFISIPKSTYLFQSDVVGIFIPQNNMYSSLPRVYVQCQSKSIYIP